jgi:hypothetical protein
LRNGFNHHTTHQAAGGFVARLFRYALVAAFFGWALPSATGIAQEKAAGLSKDDEKFLESLMRTFLFDPRGAERVQVIVKTPQPPVGSRTETREGWLVREKAGDKIVFADGEHIPAPAKDQITKVDFLAKCQKLYMDQPDPRGPRFNPFLAPERPAGKPGEEPTLVLAAWLYRLGHKELAAKVLAHAPQDLEADAAVLRRLLALSALNRMMESFGTYHDEMALDHGERLMSLYAVEAMELQQAVPLLNDLKRRKQQGTLDKKAAKDLPGDYSTWGQKKQLDFLIEALDGTEEYVSRLAQRSGGLPPRLSALVKFGESAIPALLDALEKDERMTRFVQNPHKWSHTAEVQTVRETALPLLSIILRVQHFDPCAADAPDYWQMPSDIQKAAKAARAYWKEFGHLSFEERMMRVLANQAASLPALREAARNLAWGVDPNQTRLPNLVKDNNPSPAVLKFANPTAAEAVLSAMDRDLGHDDTLPPDKRDSNRAYHEPEYFSALIRLGDRRIAPELSKRAEREKNALMRLRLAHASHRLGETQALRTFAKEFGAGKLELASDPDGGPSRWQLEHIIEYLGDAGLPEAEWALSKLSEADHRYHMAALLGLVECEEWGYYSRSILNHPWCLSILRELLDDETLTRVSVWIGANSADWVQYKRPGSSGSSMPPRILLDPSKRNASATLRRCDLAGALCQSVAGLPAFHGLLKDADVRLAVMRQALYTFRGKIRMATPAEQILLSGNTYEVWFMPQITPLGRPATDKDVIAGKAVFHLNGQGKVASVDLPARGTFKATAKGEKPRQSLIIQAEVDSNGAIHYGIIEQHEIRMASADEFSTVTPLNNLGAGKE